MFKNKNDITNCNNAVNLFKREYENMKKGLGDLQKELNEHKEESFNNFHFIKFCLIFPIKKLDFDLLSFLKKFYKLN